MEMLTAANAEVPLHCDICPRKPDFSDISHLLTHIASKGHLSSYFKMKVQADQDPATKCTLDEYDAWYEENNLQDLLRERMALKDRKKGGGNTSVSRRSSVATSSRSTPMPALPFSRHASRRGSRLRDNLLDPQLDRRVKVEPLSRSNTPTLPFLYNTSDFNRQSVHHLQPWIDSPFADTAMYIKQESPETSSEYSLYESMHARGMLGHRDFSGAPSESLISYPGDEYDDREPDHDAMTPKGVQWPGMAMFDSATPEMKRKRNQKKSVNVLRQLQLTSEIIEPEELVFDSTGALRKTRTITGEPDSSDSLIEGETEPEADHTERKRPRRRNTTARAALADKNVNTNRITRQRAAARRPLSAQPSTRGPYYDGVHDHDDDLTFGTHRPVNRSGISIHRDNSGPDITFDQPGFAYLTASFRPSSRARGQANHNRTAAAATVPRVAHPHVPSWDRFDEHSNFRNTVPGNLSYAAPANTTYETFGQFINFGNSQTTAANPFLGMGFNGGHPTMQTLFPPIGNASSSLGVSMNNDMFGMSAQAGNQTDHLTDMFGFGSDLNTGTTINPLLGFPVPTTDNTTTMCNNPLYQERTAVPLTTEGDEDEATISITSEN